MNLNDSLASTETIEGRHGSRSRDSTYEKRIKTKQETAARPTHVTIVKIKKIGDSLFVEQVWKKIERISTMGSVYGKRNTNQEEDPVTHSEEVDINNGLILSGHFLPPEVIAHILSYIDPVVVIKTRLVCKLWKDIVENHIWREKVLREVPGVDPCLFNSPNILWKDYCLLCYKKPFLKNLLKNGSAKEMLNHWGVARKAQPSGRKWLVENKPVGCSPFPEGETHCFTSSYDWCSADQVISLSECGLTCPVMNAMKPDIHIEEWYAGRFDCGFEYSMKVSLLDSNFGVIDSFVFETQEHTTEWKKVHHVFTNYKDNVCFISFHHKGKDTQFWAGHYGSKMTGAKVFLTSSGMQPPYDLQGPSTN